MDNNKEMNESASQISPYSYYRKERPEYFSDTIVTYNIPLTKELFDQQLALLSTKKQQSNFENFVVAVAKKCITPNIKPQTGPDGGGDGKVDAETYEVSDDISDKWYSADDTASGKEYWAFAISCKKQWKPKVATDVEKIVETKRGYTKALFFTNQYIKSSTRTDVEKELSDAFNIKVEIYDANCISKWVFQDNCIDIALEYLEFSDAYKQKTIKIGENDKRREIRLSEIEKNIYRHIEGLDTDYIDELHETCILSRGLGKPKTEIEGLFQRAIRECKSHGTSQQLFNIIYDHAWTSYFWFENVNETYNDYITLKESIQEQCNVTRVEKITNLLTIMNNAAKIGYFNQELIVPEILYIKGLEKTLKLNPDKQSSALYLTIYIQEQQLIEHILNKEDIKLDIQNLRPNLIQAASHLEISFESHYTVIQMLSQYIDDNEQFEDMVDELATILSIKQSNLKAAKIRLVRAEDHINKQRWSAAIKQLGFCVYAFEQEGTMTELIKSSGYMGAALNNLSLPYSAEAYLVKSAAFLIQDFFHSGLVHHELISVLQELCGIELKIGRIVMYLNWHELLSVVSQNSQYYLEESFKENFFLEDVAWACRFTASDLKNNLVAKLPDILDRVGMPTSPEILKYLLGYEEDIEESCLKNIVEICQSPHLSEQPVYDQFLDKLNISTSGQTYLRTTVCNFTFTVEYDNHPQVQRIAELFLASIEVFLATARILDIVPIDNNIHIQIQMISDSTEIVPQEDNRSNYVLRLNLNNYGGKIIWECVVKFLVTFLCKNAITREPIKTMIESKQDGEKLLDRVSVLQRTEGALNNVLGKDYKYRIEDWSKSSDKIYTYKESNLSFKERTFKNKQQNTMTSYKINSNMSLWEDAGWKECVFIQDSLEDTPSIFGLAFRNLDIGKEIVKDWKSEYKIMIYIIKGIDENHPTWYRVCIAPIISNDCISNGRYVSTVCRETTMTPPSSKNLDRFELEYKKFGGCWLMALGINKDNSLIMPTSYEGAFKFNNIVIVDAYKIDINNPARQGLKHDDKPIIPENMKNNAPVLEVLLELKNALQNVK